MAGLRAQLGWLVRGQRSTTAALDSLSLDLRELQQKVAALEGTIADLGRGQAALDARQLDEFDRVRAAVADATDDLTERVNAVHDQLRARS
jgi:septal ring factor EnvC (AmiA/AmiB activator)